MQFVDTNVLLYAALREPEAVEKQRIAELLLERDDLALSTQVLQEFYYQATRPNCPNPLSAPEAHSYLTALTDRTLVQAITLELFQQAVDTSQRFQISYWDAAILAAARTTGCDVVFSEDLNDRQNHAGLQVVNPFSAISS